MKSVIPMALYAGFFLVSCSNPSNDSDKGTALESKTLEDSIIPEEITSLVQNLSMADTITYMSDIKSDFLNSKYEEADEFLDFYKSFISQNVFSNEVISDDESVTKSINYLGVLDNISHEQSFHVLTDFTILGKKGDGISQKGVSKLIFISLNLLDIIIYRVNMPDELPIKIEANQLLYEYEGQLIKVSLKGQLPPLFCVPEIGCF